MQTRWPITYTIHHTAGAFRWCVNSATAKRYIAQKGGIFCSSILMSYFDRNVNDSLDNASRFLIISMLELCRKSCYSRWLQPHSVVWKTHRHATPIRVNRQGRQFSSAGSVTKAYPGRPSRMGLIMMTNVYVSPKCVCVCACAAGDKL